MLFTYSFATRWTIPVFHVPGSRWANSWREHVCSILTRTHTPQHTLKILDKEKELKRVTREGGREEEKKGASWNGVQYLTRLRRARNPEEKSKEEEKARSHLGEQQAFKYSAMRRSRVAILVLMTFYHCLGQRDDEENFRLSSQSLFVADYVAFYGIKQVCLLGEGEW